MKIIARMISRMIIVRFLAILLGISLFVTMLEVVSYYKEILALEPENSNILFRYLLYKFPTALVTFLPMSILLAVLLSLTELSYRNEISAIWSTGLSPFQLTGTLLPIGLVTGGLLFFIANFAIPATVPQLKAWGIADFRQERLKADSANLLWMRSGNDVMRATALNSSSTKLKDVIIFRRNEKGLLQELIFAQNADLDGNRWSLKNIAIYYAKNAPYSRLDRMVYSGAMTPATTGSRSGDPQEMTVSDLQYFISNAGFGIRPVWVYETWLQRRFALIFIPLVMIAMCIPLATRFHRGGGLGWLFAGGIGLGFVFFVIDGISVTMGELGLVAPFLGAWLAVLIFGALAIAFSLKMNRT